jgi:hypothetical protein
LTQAAIQIFVLKVCLIGAFCSLVGWVVIYTRLARWWTNPIGRTLVVKTLLVAALLIPFILALFFNLTRLDSRIVGWIDVFLIGAITPVMIWRSVVWVKASREGDETPGA